MGVWLSGTAGKYGQNASYYTFGGSHPAINSDITAQRAGKSGQNEETGKAAAMETEFARNVSKAKGESVVNEYKRKHPDSAAHVNSQVSAGKKVLLKNGADKVSREDMTMEEYQGFIMGLLNSIPFDASRMGDKEFIDITDAGWEQMKNDPEYEAWVLGYTVENRSVRNPFAGWPGASPNLCVEHFGASIEEHLGQGVPMNSPGTGNLEDDDEESWWDKRQKRMKELLEEQVKKAMVKRRATQAWEMQEYHRASMESRQRMTEFLNGRTTVGTGISLKGQALPQAVAAAIAAYGSSILMN